ncbi:hypothetical protein [Leptospira andrefontaineae]|uniref:Uncharacterized protein n=1 Tax=Leptospira andrefontaineae TaxID=2484976 RepID=A0A4R9H6T9_9LEPT|nr:hypothetical protein [Leptospira andrefontaineae]TGK41175.1 hypothetical protein EHO65_07010 [Leptospira andrefontaineae]
MNYSKLTGPVIVFSVFLNVNCFFIAQNEIRFLKTDPETKIIHEITDHSIQNVFTYSKPLLLDHSQEYLTVFATKYPRQTDGFGSNSGRNFNNSSLLELNTSSYGRYFTEIEVDSKYVKICKIKTTDCRFVESAGEIIKSIYLSRLEFNTEYDSNNLKIVNFSLIQIESSVDKSFDIRYDFFLSDLNKKYIRLIPTESSFADFEYNIETNNLFITVLYDSNKDGKFSTDIDRSAVLKVNVNHPSIGVEIINKSEIQRIFQLDKKNTN